MNRLSRTSIVVVCFLLSLQSLAVGQAKAGDWPMWRYDAGRTNVSPEKIPATLHLQWQRQLPPVQPAFRKSRLQFDQGYEPIAVGDSLFVALPHIDAVVSYAATTGEEQWRFVADGPVRLAPVAWQGRVYFGSDDGHVYCLNASDGKLQWKFRAVPSNRKILGNGRLISVWPVRGGPVIADGTLYIAAGVWPLEGVFVYAIDAESGKVVWVNDRAGSLYGQTPHNGQAMGGLSPQGYLLIHGNELLVPCGTARPGRFDRQTGKIVDFSLPGEGRSPGGWFAAADKQQAQDIRRGKILFDSGINRDRHEDKESAGDGVPGVRSRVQLGAKSLDYTAGIEGLEIENIHSVIAANGRLVVVTRNGMISCYSDTRVSAKIHKLPTRTAVASDAAIQAAATSILKATNVREGYALVLNATDGALANQLAAQTSLHVIALASEQTKTELRQRFIGSGDSSQRLWFLPGQLSEIGLPPYLADLVVATELSATELEKGEFISTLYERLRPYGGVACLAVEPKRDVDIRKWLNDANHGEAKVERSGEWLLIRRAGALPGAVDYTKDWRAPDARVRAPLGILWFDDAIGHFKRAPQPYIQSGLMISQDKAWLNEAERMGPVNKAHIDGTGRFRLADTQFMDVYTGRVVAKEEATARLDSIPSPPDSEFRPPYHYRPPFVEAFRKEHEANGTRPEKWPFLVELKQGMMTNPITGLVEPRRYVKSYGCDGGNDYGQLITMRSATPAFYDKRIESGTINISGPRSGCTNSIIPAGGVLNLPYFYDGCTCSYPLPTGAALVSMPQKFEQWTAWGKRPVGPIVRIGLNLGAPGDRMTHNGTLFLDVPSIGGPSPEIVVETEPKTPDMFYHHSLFTQGGRGWPWVCASGAEGITSIRLSGIKPGSFTVRLYFIEPHHTTKGVRRFDVSLQGDSVLKDFDIFAEAGGKMKCVVKEFSNITLSDTCEIKLT
ncbi:MAG: outer membrane protein assembly factor BamB, partial [Pirellulaceae bacterium]